MTMSPGSQMLYLLRHAHAGDSLAWEGPDALRPLSKRGRRQAEQLGAFLATRDARPDRIVASSRLRAVQTADLVAAALGLEVTVDPRLADAVDLADMEALLADIGGAAPMLVGHDPDFSSALGELCDAPGVVMKKAALAAIEVERPLAPGGGQLRWLVTPDLLETR